jgi:UDP-arabinose 4-epimerase
MPRPIIVTGGAGYVGSHAAKALAASGYLPVTVDNLSHGYRWAVRWGPIEVGDLLDPEFIAAVLRKWQPEAVMHFAGLIAVGESVVDPARYYRNNVTGTFNLLDAMQASGVARIVFSSTAAVYGIPDLVPIQETAPRRPVNPYGTSKSVIETVLADYGTAHGLRSVALRYFNAAGADPDGEIGEAHEPETHLIPLALDAAAGKRGPLTILGTDYPTADGTCIRDYIHVADLAAAHMRALDFAAAAPAGTAAAFNLGTGAGFSVRQIVDAVARVTGRSVPHKFGDRRAGDAPELVADPALARRILQWQAVHSDLDTIVRTAWNWVNRPHPNAEGPAV